MQIAKKITIGTINGIRGGFACNWTEGKPETQAAFLAGRIIGIARSVDAKQTTYGEAARFTGEFRAINQDGEEIAAPTLYLPSPADGLLKSAIVEADGGAVNFAFDIYVQPTPKKQPGDRGYEYVIKPLLETKPSDPLAELAKALPAPAIKPKQEQLPGVATEAAQAPAAPQVPSGDVPADTEPPKANGKHGKK